MNWLKRNIKNIFIIVLIILITSCVSIYATETIYHSSDIYYTKSDNTVVSVNSALNELYERAQGATFGTVYTDSSKDTMQESNSWTIDLPAGKYLCEAVYFFSGGMNDITEVENTTDDIVITADKNIEYDEMDNINYVKSGEVKCLWDGAQYLNEWCFTKTFLVSSEDDVTLTATINMGWSNAAVPVIMTFNCIEVL